jgi:hypothetical protein
VPLMSDFGISPLQLGTLLSAFFWTIPSCRFRSATSWTSLV